MNIRVNERDAQALDYFREQQVLTLPALAEALHCSPITAHRRLKEWKAYTSYNLHGQYHTLPSIPVFNAYGIWQWGTVLFSRYGTMKQTVITLVRSSPQGLDHEQLEHILGVNPKYNLAQYAEIPGITKEQHRGRIIYFSDDPQMYTKQKRKSVPPPQSLQKLPDDALTILILVTRIQHPGMTCEQLTEQLEAQGHSVSLKDIAALFAHYGIDKKN
jgi:hypothetical protein